MGALTLTNAPAHLLDPDLPLAILTDAIQAGGGGSFGGGGGGGGGSGFGGGGFGGGGDGGEGLGYLIYFLLRLVFEYPLIGIPALVATALVFTYGSRQGWWAHQKRTIRRRSGERRRHLSAVSTAALRENDPDFDERGFLVRVAAAFRKAQDAWCAHDLEPLRPFVTDGVFERFSLQIAEQRDDGRRDVVNNLRVGGLTIAHVEAGAHFDTVTVRVPFHADIHRVDIATGEQISGSKLPRSFFVEMWSFLRRRGARTIDGEGLIEGKCPNCGAPLSMKQSAQCASCACLARSGQFDWVLAEITQESVWSAERERDIPGLADHTRSDAGLSVQGLEDYASVAFWRKLAADRAGRVDALVRVGETAFIDRYARHLASRKSWYTDAAVGSVRTLGVLPGDARDRVVIEIVWDGRRAKLEDDGSLDVRQTRYLHHTLFVFTRAAGAQSRLDDAFTTMHCRTCGAHDTGGIEPACPYCGSPRTGDRSTWLLAGVHGQHDPEARALRAELAGLTAAAPTTPDASTVELLEWAVALVRADGVVDDDEQRAVRSLAARQHAAPELVEALLQADAAPVDTTEAIGPYAARERLAGLARLALADGQLDGSEKRLLIHAANRLGLPRVEVELLVRKIGTELYRASRAAHRHERQRG